MSTRKNFKTDKGTELPLLNLKGKEYLQVAHRLVWFREAHPTGIIKTTMLAMNGEGDGEYAVFKAEIYVPTEQGPMCVASGHKKETKKDFPDFIEKAETGSIGRALAMAGFGTQFTGDDLNEKERLADAPVEVIVSGTANGAATDAAVAAVTKRASFRQNAAKPAEDI